MDRSKFFVSKGHAMRNLASYCAKAAADLLFRESGGSVQISQDEEADAFNLLAELVTAYSWVERQQAYRLLAPDRPRLVAASDVLAGGSLLPTYFNPVSDERYFIGNSWFPMFSSTFPTITAQELELFNNWRSNHAFQCSFFEDWIGTFLCKLTSVNYLGSIAEGEVNLSFSTVLRACFIRLVLPMDLPLNECDLLAAEYLLIYRRYQD